MAQKTYLAAYHWLSLCIVLACIVVNSGVAFGQITLDGDFDHGGLDEANSSVNGNMVTLAGRDNFNSGQWKWLYFSADNVNGVQPTFQIDDDFVTGGDGLDDHAMVYSYDQQNWLFFDNNARESGAGTFTFSNNSAFTQNQVYVAYGLPYSYQRVVDHTAQIATSPWVSPTVSANSSLVIGQSPGGIDDLGRVVAPRDMYGFKITDSTVTNSKTKIVLNGGVHPNETLGNHALEGLLDFLVSDDLEAAILREHAEFFIYPMANPDGRFAGYNRSTVEFVNFDANRHWEPLANPPYDGQSDIQLVGDAMIADTGGDVDFFIDFHSTVADKLGHYGWVLPASQNDPFWLTLLQLEPTLGTRNSTLSNFTAARFGRDVLGAEFSSTLETEFIEGDNIDRFHALGRNYGLAWEQILRLVGDLNFDGVVNSQDWSLFIAGAETDLSGLSNIDAYSQGDLDGDGVNSALDFGLFKQAFETANGAGSFVSMLAEVPEPGSASLLLIGALLSTIRR